MAKTGDARWTPALKNQYVLEVRESQDMRPRSEGIIEEHLSIKTGNVMRWANVA